MVEAVVVVVEDKKTEEELTMPWIKKDDCIGCKLCVESCPVNTIYMEAEKAIIELEGCIRCGKCHDVCPQDAVRHDSEKVPEEVEDNINWVKSLMKHYDSEEEKSGFLHRINKHFNKEKKVIERTLDKINSLEM